MREFKKHRSRRDELLWLLVKSAGTVVLLVVTIGLMRAAWGMYGKMASAAQAKEEANEQLAQVTTQQQGVNNTLSEISSSRGEEAQIRERFGVVRPGEGEIDIIQNNAVPTTTPQQKESWWGRIFHTLFVW